MNAPLAANVDREWRTVDRDHVASLFLEVKGVPTASAADIEDTAFGQFQGFLLVGGPFFRFGQIQTAVITIDLDQAILAFDDR